MGIQTHTHSHITYDKDSGKPWKHWDQSKQQKMVKVPYTKRDKTTNQETHNKRCKNKWDLKKGKLGQHYVIVIWLEQEMGILLGRVEGNYVMEVFE